MFLSIAVPIVIVAVTAAITWRLRRRPSVPPSYQAEVTAAVEQKAELLRHQP